MSGRTKAHLFSAMACCALAWGNAPATAGFAWLAHLAYVSRAPFEDEPL